VYKVGNWFRPIFGWFAIRERRNAKGEGEFIDAGHICRIPAVGGDDPRRHVTIEVKLLGDLPPETPTAGSSTGQQTLAEDTTPDPDTDYTTELGTQTLRRGADGWDLT
jgi:hypothetical protein